MESEDFGFRVPRIYSKIIHARFVYQAEQEELRVRLHLKVPTSPDSLSTSVLAPILLFLLEIRSSKPLIGWPEIGHVTARPFQFDAISVTIQ